MIGIIDSGIGGITVYHAVKRLLPHMPVVYYADSANIPYGTKEPSAIVDCLRRSADVVIEQGARMVIIACHTAAIALGEEDLGLPTLRISEYGALSLLKEDDLERIALLGTRFTIESFSFQDRLPGRHLFPVSMPLFVPLVEEGFAEHPLADAMAITYLDHLRDAELDAALLACTHFPFVGAAIQRALGSHVILVDPASLCAEAARQLAYDLSLSPMAGEDLFLSSGSPRCAIEQYKQGKLHGAKTPHFAY